VADLVLPSGIVIPDGPSLRELSAGAKWGSSSEGKSSRIQQATSRSIPTVTQLESKFRDYQSFLGAVRIPWVFSCVSVLAFTFATNGWGLVDEEDEPTDDPEDPFTILMARPNPVQSAFQFKAQAEMYLELTGNCYIALEERDGMGRPREVYLPNPARMQVIPDPENFIKGYAYDTGRAGPLRYIPYDADEVVHIKWPNPLNDYYGFGNVEASTDLLDIVVAMASHERAYWESGGRIVGVLQTDDTLTDQEFDDVRRHWQESNADRRNRVRTAILEHGLKYTPIAEGMRSLDLVNIDRGKRQQIQAVFGVPDTKLGILDNAQYKQEDADRFFYGETMESRFTIWEDGVQPLVDLFDEAKRWRMDRRNFDDDTSKLDNAKKMTESGQYTLDEARIYAGADPLPGDVGRVLFVPTGLTPVKVDDLGQYADDALAQEPPPPGVPGVPDDGGDPADDGAAGSNLVRLADHVPGMKALSDIERRERAAEIIAQEQVDRERRRRMAIVVARERAKGRRTAPGLKALVGAWEGKRIGTPAKLPSRVGMRLTTKHPAMAFAVRRDFERLAAAEVPQGKQAIQAALAKARTSLVKTPLLSRLMRTTGDGAQERRRALLESNLALDPLRAALHGVWDRSASAGYAVATRLTPMVKAVDGWQHVKAPDSAAIERLDNPDAPASVTAQFPRMGGRIDRSWQQISGTMYDDILGAVQEGIRRGYTPLQVAEGYPDEGYDGIGSYFGDNALDWRSEMIARTEMRSAYEAGAFERYAEAGITEVEGTDGTEDQNCADVNGEIFPLENGSPVGAPEEHPNGTRSWMPVLETARSVWTDPVISDD
jgi:HK97 family phage portal protein